MTSPAASTPAPLAVDFATEWLDEEGIICPKMVDYATQCPKGHALVALADSGCSPAQQPLICRVCHTSAVSEDEAWEWVACSVPRCCAGYTVCGGCIRQLQQAPAAAADGHGFVSLVRAAAQLRAFVTRRDAEMQGVAVLFLAWLKSTFGAVLGRLTVEQVCQMFIKPRTSRSRSSLADELMLQADSRQHVGEATWFISHTWNNAFADTLDAVLLFFEGREDAATAKVWFDVLVDGQHAIAGPSKPSSWYMTTFRSSIERIGSLLLVVDKWNNPTALRRAWCVQRRSLCARAALSSAHTVVTCRCVLELHAIAVKKAEGAGEFAVAMTRDERRRFLDGIRADPREYYNMLGSVNAESSDCSRRADRDSIHEGIRSSVGFARLSRMLFSVLEDWMQGQLEARASTCAEAGDEVEAMRWTMTLANVLSDQGRHQEAVEMRVKVLDVCSRMLAEDDPEQGEAYGGARVALHA